MRIFMYDVGIPLHGQPVRKDESVLGWSLQRPIRTHPRFQPRPPNTQIALHIKPDLTAELEVTTFKVEMMTQEDKFHLACEDEVPPARKAALTTEVERIPLEEFVGLTGAYEVHNMGRAGFQYTLFIRDGRIKYVRVVPSCDAIQSAHANYTAWVKSWKAAEGAY